MGADFKYSESVQIIMAHLYGRKGHLPVDNSIEGLFIVNLVPKRQNNYDNKKASSCYSFGMRRI